MEAESKRIKLIWEFHGPESIHMARHHAVHLKEYAERNALESPETGVAKIDTGYMAFLVVDEARMIEVRDALIPLRGEWA